MNQLPEVKTAIEALDRIRHRALDEDPKADVWARLDSSAVAWIVNEIRKCRADFEYAAGNYFWLRQTKTAKSMLFSLWEQQQLFYDIVKRMWAEGRPAWVIVHKARQLGISSVVEALMAWKNLFFSQQVSMIVSQNPEHAAYMFSQLQYHIQKVPWWMRPAVMAFERKEVMILANDGSLGENEDGLMNFIVANGANKMSSFGQGKPLHNVHITESSQFRPSWRAQEIIEGDIQNALVDRPGCFCVLESKPNGVGNYWHKLWNYYYSKLGKGQFYPLYIPAFFESSRRKPAPAGFKLKEEEIKIRERYALEWHRCNSCGKPVPTYCQSSEALLAGEKARPEVSVTCIACGSKVHSPIWLDDDQIYWYRVKREDAEEKGKESLKKFLQEMSVTPEEGFQASGIQVFPDDVYRYVQSTVRPGVRGFFDEDNRFHFGERCKICGQNHDIDDPPLQIWEVPQPGARYVFGADVAYGDEDGDYSVIHMLKLGYGFEHPDEQVAEWRGHISAGEFAQVCYKLGRAYNWAKACIEAHGSGDVTQWEMWAKMGYPGEIFQWKHYDSTSNVRTNKAGWWTTLQTKKMLITNSIRWLRLKIWAVRSPEFLFEMPTFTRDFDEEGAGGAVKGAHDDCVMAGMIACFCAHDDDFDPESGRIVIPSTRVKEPESINPGAATWICRCPRGHEWETSQPHTALCEYPDMSNKETGKCGMKPAMAKKNCGPPKREAYIEPPEPGGSHDEMFTGTYMEL